MRLRTPRTLVVCAVLARAGVRLVAIDQGPVDVERTARGFRVWLAVTITSGSDGDFRFQDHLIRLPVDDCAHRTLLTRRQRNGQPPDDKRDRRTPAPRLGLLRPSARDGDLTAATLPSYKLSEMAEGDRFAELLSGVARAVTRRQASEVCCGDLTLAQFQTLRSISRAKRSSIGSLSAELQVNLSTMSRNVALLEKNGYLSRARSEADGRIVEVTLTPKGDRALHTLRCGERDVLGDVYERLSPVERPRIVKALETLSACLEQSEDGAACCPPPAARKAATCGRRALPRAPGRGRGARHRVPARHRGRLGHHGRAARGRERRDRAAREHARDRRGARRADPRPSAPISGAHFNPAVTRRRRRARAACRWRDVPAYVAAQVAGAFVGVAAGARDVRARRSSPPRTHVRCGLGAAARASSSRRSGCSPSSGAARAPRPGAGAVRRRRVHHGGLLVHVVDVVREPGRHARARRERHLRRASGRPTRRPSSSRSSPAPPRRRLCSAGSSRACRPLPQRARAH